jgi:hypothetical protein
MNLRCQPGNKLLIFFPVNPGLFFVFMFMIMIWLFPVLWFYGFMRISRDRITTVGTEIQTN